VPGAGPVTAARFARRGLACVADLVTFLPRAYEDYRRRYTLAELASVPTGTAVVVRGEVVRVHKFFRRMLDVTIAEGGARLRARWFRPNAGMAKTYARGTVVALAARLRRTQDGEPELIHPSNVTALVTDAGGAGIRPRYSLVEGVPGRTVEKVVAAALAALGGRLVSVVPEEVRARLGLPDLAAALATVHQPPVELSAPELAALVAGISPAQRALAFERLFVMQVGLAQERARAGAQPGLVCGDAARTLATVRAALPFALTAGQEQASTGILAALAKGAPLQCLLQGDVGSGKTAVAFAAMVHVARAGGQTLVMAPTTVLAEQHAQTLGAWAERAGVRVGLLHAGLPAATQRGVLAAAAAGTVDVLVGTHALLEERLRLSRLGLAVVDEQHRFGVRQRARLRRLDPSENGWQNRAPGGMVPHLLVLSATPIPRSLALTLYGDLDLVTLTGLPPGRQPVPTGICTGAEARTAAYAALGEAVGRGGQGFVICPAIAEGEGGRRPRSAVALGKALRAELPHVRIGVLHGQLPAEEQQASVAAFRAGALDVLVATTVVEVGVDVPNAEIMIVEDAERFGLAQLHQLRGRVGRGERQAACYLLTSSDEAEAGARLAVVAEVHDGFRIAEEDLRQRGAGDVHGTRQAGMPDLGTVDLASYLALLEAARAAAETLLGSDSDLARPEHAALCRAVATWQRQARPIAEEAG
jgi:ATP-dependent DNA helicase RecG